MYRCYACDNPAQTHHTDCPLYEPEESVTDPSPDERINIASGEDVVLES